MKSEKFDNYPLSVAPAKVEARGEKGGGGREGIDKLKIISVSFGEADGAWGGMGGFPFANAR